MSLIVVALCAPWLAPYDPIDVNPKDTRLAPDWHHPLGTDYAGRDIYSRLLYSIRLAYWGGLWAIAITAAFGTTLGVLVGYYGGWFDVATMRFIDLWLALPGLLFLLVMIAH